MNQMETGHQSFGVYDSNDVLIRSENHGSNLNVERNSVVFDSEKEQAQKKEETWVHTERTVQVEIGVLIRSQNVGETGRKEEYMQGEGQGIIENDVNDELIGEECVLEERAFVKEIGQIEQLVNDFKHRSVQILRLLGELEGVTHCWKKHATSKPAYITSPNGEVNSNAGHDKLTTPLSDHMNFPALPESIKFLIEKQNQITGILDDALSQVLTLKDQIGRMQEKQPCLQNSCSNASFAAIDTGNLSYWSLWGIYFQTLSKRLELAVFAFSEIDVFSFPANADDWFRLFQNTGDSVLNFLLQNVKQASNHFHNVFLKLAPQFESISQFLGEFLCSCGFLGEFSYSLAYFTLLGTSIVFVFSVAIIFVYLFVYTFSHLCCNRRMVRSLSVEIKRHQYFYFVMLPKKEKRSKRVFCSLLVLFFPMSSFLPLPPLSSPLTPQTNSKSCTMNTFIHRTNRKSCTMNPSFSIPFPGPFSFLHHSEALCRLLSVCTGKENGTEKKTEKETRKWKEIMIVNYANKYHDKYHGIRKWDWKEQRKTIDFNMLNRQQWKSNESSWRKSNLWKELTLQLIFFLSKESDAIDAKIVTAAITCLKYIAREEVVKSYFVSLDGFCCIYRHAKFHRLSAGVQDAVITLLYNLCSLSSNKQAIMSNSWLSVLIDAMDNYPKNVRIQSKACALVGQLAIGEENEARMYSLLKKNFVPRILRSLTLFPFDPMLQADCCLALRNLAMAEIAEKQIVALGGLNLIFLALFNHPKDVRVQAEAVAALHNLACDEHSRIYLQDDRLFGLRMILRTMQMSPNCIDIQQRCLRLCRNLCHSAPSFLQRRMVVGDPPDHYLPLPCCQVVPPIYQFQPVKKNVVTATVDEATRLGNQVKFESVPSFAALEANDGNDTPIYFHDSFAEMEENNVVENFPPYDVRELVAAFHSACESKKNKSFLKEKKNAFVHKQLPCTGLASLDALAGTPFQLPLSVLSGNWRLGTLISTCSLLSRSTERSSSLSNPLFMREVSSTTEIDEELHHGCSTFSVFDEDTANLPIVVDNSPPLLRPMLNRSRSETYNSRFGVNENPSFEINAHSSTPSSILYYNQAQSILPVTLNGEKTEKIASFCRSPVSDPFPIKIGHFPISNQHSTVLNGMMARRQSAPDVFRAAGIVNSADLGTHKMGVTNDVGTPEVEIAFRSKLSAFPASETTADLNTLPSSSVKSLQKCKTAGDGAYDSEKTALELILHLIDAHESNEDIEVESLWTLTSFAQFPLNKTDMLAAGVLGRLLKIMNRNAEFRDLNAGYSSRLHYNALSLLSVIASNFPWSHCVWKSKKMGSPILFGEKEDTTIKSEQSNSLHALVSEISSQDSYLNDQKNDAVVQSNSQVSVLLNDFDHALLEIEIHRLHSMSMQKSNSLSLLYSELAQLPEKQIERNQNCRIKSVNNFNVSKMTFGPSLYSRLNCKFPALQRMMCIPASQRPESDEFVAKVLVAVAACDSRLLSSYDACCHNVGPDPLKCLSFQFEKGIGEFSLLVSSQSTKSSLTLASDCYGLPESAWSSWSDLPQLDILHLRNMIYLGANYSINEKLIGSVYDAFFTRVMLLLIACGVTILPRKSNEPILNHSFSTLGNENPHRTEELRCLSSLYSTIQTQLQKEMTMHFHNCSNLPSELLALISSYIHCA